MDAHDDDAPQSEAPQAEPELVQLAGTLDLQGKFEGHWNYSNNPAVGSDFVLHFDAMSGQHRGFFRIQRTEKSTSKISEWMQIVYSGDNQVSGRGANRFGDFKLHGTFSPDDGEFAGFKEYVRLKPPAAPTPVTTRRDDHKRHREPNKKYDGEADDPMHVGARARAVSRGMAFATDDDDDGGGGIVLPPAAAVYFDYAAQEAQAPHLSLPRTGSERQQRARKRLRDMVISLQRRHFYDAAPNDTTLGPPESHPLHPFVKPVPVPVVFRQPKQPRPPAAPRPPKKTSGTSSSHATKSLASLTPACDDAKWGALLSRIRPVSTAIRPPPSKGVAGVEEVVEAAIEADGSVYQGRLLNGARHGHGVVVYANGHTYCGEFRKGTEHGEGELRDETGALVYRGFFEAGSISGRGTYYYTDGYVYGGDVREGVRHGKGSMWAPDGSVYEGDCVFGQRTGHGIYLSAAGSYKGEWLDDQRHGRGTMKLRDGTRLEGMFAHGQPEGRCLVVFPDGSRYEGNFKDGLKDSRGTYTFANGCVYEGRFRADAIAGTGTLKLKSGMSLELPAKDGDATKHEWMTPIDLSAHQELRLVHLKAGFSATGT